MHGRQAASVDHISAICVDRRRAQTGYGRWRRERGGTVRGLRGTRVHAGRADGLEEDVQADGPNRAKIARIAGL